MSVDVAIIGGGVSGLATAYGLKRLGHRVAVLERQATSGGNAVSERFGGFLMEHGPSTMNADSTAATGLSRELGIDHDRCDLGDGVRQRYLVARGRLQGISTSPLGFLFSGYLSPRARLRLLAEIAVSSRGDHGGDHNDETVMAFVPAVSDARRPSASLILWLPEYRAAGRRSFPSRRYSPSSSNWRGISVPSPWDFSVVADRAGRCREGGSSPGETGWRRFPVFSPGIWTER